MRCIVSTQPGGLPAFTHPVASAMACLTHGGAGYRGQAYRDRQIAAFMSDGISERAAVRWVNAWLDGGLTDAEAYEVIRDKDLKPDWTGAELWDRSEVPTDRWFRSAWHRSQNGGPLDLNFNRARHIQFQHIEDAVTLENKRRRKDFTSEFSLEPIVPIVIDEMFIRRRIVDARDEQELRAVWYK